MQETQTAPTEQAPSLSEALTQFAPTEEPTKEVAPEVAPAEGEPSETNAEEADASVEAAPEPETYDAILERIKGTPVEEEFKAREDRIRRDSERKGMIEGQKREAGRRQQLDTHGAQGTQALAIIADSLRRAVEEGQGTPQAFGAILQAQGQGLAHLDNWNRGVATAVNVSGQERAMNYLAARIASHPAVKDNDLGQQFLDRLHLDFSIADHEERGRAVTETISDLLQVFEERIADRAKKPAQAAVAKAEAAIEKGKLAARQNGPDTAPKGGGGTNKAYSALTSEERAALAKLGPRAVDAHIERFGA